MKNMKKRTLLLILTVVLLSVLTGCMFMKIHRQQKELRELPLFAQDDTGDFALFGDTCLSFLNLSGDPAYYFVSERGYIVGHWEGTYALHPVYAYGAEDFGEDVCLEIWSEFPMAKRKWLYMKPDFQFPDYMALTCSKICLTEEFYAEGRFYRGYDEPVELIQFREGEKISLGDIVTETEKPGGTSVYLGDVHVYFCEYRTMYLGNVMLKQFGDRLYLCVMDRGDSAYYLIRDEYQMLFQNAIQ